MAGLKDFLQTLGNSINAPELIELSSKEDLPELVIEDETFEGLKTKFGSLMTEEAARNNPQIINAIKEELKPQIKKSVLGNIDSELLQTSRDLWGDEFTSELNGIDNTYERIKKFAEQAKKQIAEGSKDSKLKETLERQKKQMEEIQKNFQAQLDEKDIKLNEIQTGYTQKLIDKQLDNELSTYKLGKQYSEDFVKKALFDELKNKIRKQAKLTLSDDFSIGLKNPEDDQLDLIINNKKVENVKDLINPIIQPFVDKHPGEKKEGQETYTPAKDTKISRLAEDFRNRKSQTLF